MSDEGKCDKRSDYSRPAPVCKIPVTHHRISTSPRRRPLYLSVIVSSSAPAPAVENARGRRVRRFIGGRGGVSRSRGRGAASMRRRVAGGRGQRRRLRRTRTPLTAPLSTTAVGGGGAVDGVRAAAEIKPAGNVSGEKGSLVLPGGSAHFLKSEEVRPKGRFALFRLESRREGGGKIKAY